MRFYVDEDCLGLGYAMMWARPDTVTCAEEMVVEVLPRRTADADWLPIVSGHGWVVITGNRRIREDPTESVVAVREHARIICVHDPSGASSTWDKLAQLTRYWDRIEGFIATHHDGPWWLSVPPSGDRKSVV